MGAVSMGVLCWVQSAWVWCAMVGAVSMCGLLALVQSACVGC